MRCFLIFNLFFLLTRVLDLEYSLGTWRRALCEVGDRICCPKILFSEKKSYSMDTKHEYNLSIEALSTVLKHSLKYPNNFVFGAVIGSIDRENPSKKKIYIDYAVPFIHSLPFFHVTTTFTRQLYIYINEFMNTKKCKIIGFYCSPEFSNDDSSIPSFVYHTVNNITSKYVDDDVVFLKLNPPTSSLSHITFSCATESKFTPNFFSHHFKPLTSIENLIRSEIFIRVNITDFQSHLENSEFDWLCNLKERLTHEYIPLVESLS